MTRSKADRGTNMTAAVRGALSIVLLAAILALLSFMTGRTSTSSPEAGFSDNAPSGMKLVPASCESNPPYAHYTGECDAACSPQYYCQGKDVYYRAANCQALDVQFCPKGCLAGKCTGATCTSGNFCSGPSLFHRDSECNVTLQENCSGGCMDGQCLANNGFCAPAYFCTGDTLNYRSSNCDEQKIQVCAGGCGGASCLTPTNPIASIVAVPSLVRTNATTMVTWASTSTISCTVTSPNGDSWTGVGGSQTSLPIPKQTIFTLDCVPPAGATHIIRSVTVDILPVFEEK